MTKARDIANLVDANGDIVSGALDNVPPSNDASALTIGTIDNARISLDANEIPNLDTAKITTGTFLDARIPSLDTSKITSGTFSDARMPATVLNSNVDLTNLSATNLTSGTLPDARFPATLPAASGANLTSINASNLSSGTVPIARLGSGTKNSTTFLRGDNTFASPGGGANTPAFRGYATSDQIVNGVYSKVTLAGENFDTDNAFSSSRFTVPTGKGGTYYFSTGYELTNGTGSAFLTQIQKNGSTRYRGGYWEGNSITSPGLYVSYLIDANAGDYFEFYMQVLGHSNQSRLQAGGSEQRIWFEGFRLIS